MPATSTAIPNGLFRVANVARLLSPLYPAVPVPAIVEIVCDLATGGKIRQIDRQVRSSGVGFIVLKIGRCYNVGACNLLLCAGISRQTVYFYPQIHAIDFR